jgi:hemoglobin
MLGSAAMMRLQPHGRSPCPIAGRCAAWSVWKHRGKDGLRREKQLLINFLCASAGGPMYYVGRDMKISHRGLGISESDWDTFIGHLEATLATFEVPASERAEVLAFVASTKADIVE